MSLPTRFTQADAVDTWDAEFRWREAGRLRDLTVDDTWWRVAEGAASSERTLAPLWSHRFVDGFSGWRFLPEESLLRTLGTPGPARPSAEPGAVLNVSAFVQKLPYSGPRFDRLRFVATAALAVRFLDDAAAALDPEFRPSRLRIGVVGLSDALHALGLDYAGAPAREQAMQAAQALAEGCLRGSIDLAEERGWRIAPARCRPHVERMQGRGMPAWLVERVQRLGLCHDGLTAIDPHPLLARLANGVADGIDPLAAPGTPGPPAAAVCAMRAALQPWIDEPIAPVVQARPSQGRPT